jgi:hypothetical protein
LAFAFAALDQPASEARAYARLVRAARPQL